MKLEQRVARLEMAARGLRDNGCGVLLSPNDVCLLMIEKANLEDSPQFSDRVDRIDAVLESHSRASTRNLKPLTPEEAATAMREAFEREADPEAAEKYRQERLDALLAC